MDPSRRSPQPCTMYKMCNDQWDEDSTDEKNSLYSSFWSDGEVVDKDEEVEIMREIDFRHVIDSEGPPPESLRDDHLELKSLGIFTDGVLEEESDNASNERTQTSRTSGSPAVSPMTSGYGTYKADEQELLDPSDDYSRIRFNQDSRVLSKFRDNEEDFRSLRIFTKSDHEETQGPDVREPVACVSEESRGPAVAASCDDDSTLKEVSVVDMKPPVGIRLTSEGQHIYRGADDVLLFRKQGLEDGIDENEERTQEKQLYNVDKNPDGIDENEERTQEKQLYNVDKNPEQVSAIDPPDESSSNNNIKFIDSKRDLSFKIMSAKWEENLMWKRDAVSYSQESETEAGHLGAFKSKSMTETQSHEDVRPKPKSFILPVITQPTIKKSDPVARYFHYKEMWDRFQMSGEKDRKALSWEIKEKLAYQALPPKPRRVFVPNTYIVPTEKKRSELRWMIRNDLANGLIPQKFNSQF